MIIPIAGAGKLVIAGGASLAAWRVWYTMPSNVLKRKLFDLFRIGELYFKYHGYKKKELRNYPVIKHVTSYIDRMEVVFVIPHGLDPKAVLEKGWLFQQMFGSLIELACDDDSATFVFTIYNTALQQFEYDSEEIDVLVTKDMVLPIYVGKSRKGDVIYDMADHPHLLIAGETGAGKSVCLRSLLTTLIRHRNDTVDLYCADLKRSEFHLFKGIAKEVAVEDSGLKDILIKLMKEMTKRGNLLDKAELAHIKDLPKDKRPNYIVLAIDEVTMIKGNPFIMDSLEKISALGRSLGILIILSMQRPDADVLDGKLKNNLTVRISFRASDEINSRITIGSGEAAHIKNSEVGKMVFKLDKLTYVQGAKLELDMAKQLLVPFKMAHDHHESSSLITSEDESDSLIIVGEEDDNLIIGEQI